jgi:hypothetical protein
VTANFNQARGEAIGDRANPVEHGSGG